MDEPHHIRENHDCCICFETGGTLEYQRYWSCSASHADYICRECMLQLMRDASSCPICRAKNIFETISIRNLENFFVNNQIFDNDVIDIITNNQITNNIYSESISIINTIMNIMNDNMIRIPLSNQAQIIQGIGRLTRIPINIYINNINNENIINNINN